MTKAISRAERNIRWIEEYCRVPEGRLVGQNVKLRDWQKAELRKIYDNPHGTRRALVSFGRKNGKTALAAFLCLLHLCGPEAVPNSQLYSAAQSRDQASILFSLAAKTVRMSPELNAVVTIRDTAKQLACQELGTLYRALSAEASTAYGLSPVFIVHDELGQVRGPRSELYEALETATGAQENPLSVAISTQAPNPTDLFSVLIDDAKTGADPRVILSLYEAPEDADPFCEETIRLANPAFGDFQNAEETLAMAQDAKRMPSREAEYRNLILNQRVEMYAPFVSQAVWKINDGAPLEDWKDLPVFGGLDLSSTTDLTALVLIAPEEDGIWGVKSRFWLPKDTLKDRAKADRVPYDLWHEQGFLEAAPGKTVDYEYVAGIVSKLHDELNIFKIGFDRYNWKHLRPWLEKAGFGLSELEGDNAIFEQMGQGYVSMSPALRDVESHLINARMRHGGHPVLEMCAKNAVIDQDPAGNRKLNKQKATGRIDGMVALAMATSMASTYFIEEAPSPWDSDPEFRMVV